MNNGLRKIKKMRRIIEKIMLVVLALSITVIPTVKSSVSASEAFTLFYDNFATASSASGLFTPDYKSLPTDSTKPIYSFIDGTYPLVSEGKVTLNYTRITIGASSEEETTENSTIPGALYLKGNYRIKLKIDSIYGDDFSKFQVFVDNTTTNKESSIHGSKSLIFESTLSDLRNYLSSNNDYLIIESSVGTETSFIQLCAEFMAYVTISEIVIESESASKETIVSVITPSPVTVIQGDTLVLPSQVTAVYVDGSKKDVDISWEAVDTSTPGTKTVKGRVEGYDKEVIIIVDVDVRTVTLFYDNFTTATEDNLFTPDYKSLPTDSTKSMYIKTGGSIPVSKSYIIFNGASMLIGASSFGENTTENSTVPGVFNLKGDYRIKLRIDSYAGYASKKIQIFVDNNTTNKESSIHGSKSLIFESTLSNLGQALNNHYLIIYSNVGTETSFIQLNAETGMKLNINEIVIESIVSKETITSVITPSPVTVKQGDTPILPNKVTAIYSDGSEKDVDISWEAVDTSTPGAKTIKGSVEGYDKDVTMIVNVEEVSTENPPQKEAVTLFYDNFATATQDNFFTPEYKSLPTDSTKPMYSFIDGSYPSVSEGTVTLCDTRMTIGASSPNISTTSADSTTSGVFNLKGNYRIKLKLNRNEIEGFADKKFQVFVDNNTTNKEFSIHGNASLLWEGTLLDFLGNEYIIIESNVGTETSFIQLRTESMAYVPISEIVIESESVSKETITSVITPSPVTVKQGDIPVLPSKVTAVYVDESKKDVDISWEAVDTSTPGTKTVKGRVEGYDKEVTMIVNITPLEVKDFTINSTFNLNTLEAGKNLNVETSILSNKEVTEPVMLIVALYDENDRMLNVSYISKTIVQGETLKLNAGFKLPSDVTNHIVKVFVWNGTSLKDTNMKPLSNIVTLK